jgi:hypothetical protein
MVILVSKLPGPDDLIQYNVNFEMVLGTQPQVSELEAKFDGYISKQAEWKITDLEKGLIVKACVAFSLLDASKSDLDGAGLHLPSAEDKSAFRHISKILDKGKKALSTRAHRSNAIKLDKAQAILSGLVDEYRIKRTVDFGQGRCASDMQWTLSEWAQYCYRTELDALLKISSDLAKEISGFDSRSVLRIKKKVVKSFAARFPGLAKAFREADLLLEKKSGRPGDGSGYIIRPVYSATSGKVEPRVCIGLGPSDGLILELADIFRQTRKNPEDKMALNIFEKIMGSMKPQHYKERRSILEKARAKKSSSEYLG